MLRRTSVVSALLIFAAAAAAASPTPLGGQFLINTTTAGEQSLPDVAVGLSGDFVAVWKSGPAGAVVITAQRFDNSGSKTGGEITVSSGVNDASRPNVAYRPAGGFVVVWEEDAGTDQVWMRCYDSGGSPATSPIQIDPTAGSESRPAIAMAADGMFAVALTSSADIYVAQFTQTGTLIGTPFLANAYTGGNQINARVAVDTNKDIIATWDSFGQDGSGYGVYARRFTWAGAHGTEFPVNSYTTSGQSNSDIAVKSDNSYVVAWMSEQQDGTPYSVYAKRFSSTDTQQGFEVRVNTYTSLNQMTPRIAVDGSDGYTIVWSSYGQDGDGTGVYAQHFLADGTFEGTEYQISQTTAGNQGNPNISTGGYEVVVWDSGTSTELLDVYGRRYSAPLVGPELSAALHSPPEIYDASAALVCSLTVYNAGTRAGAFRTSLYASSDTTFTGADQLLGQFTLDSLAAGGDTTQAFTSAVPTELGSGEIYLGVVVDDLDQVTELDETNNTACAPLQLNMPVIYSVEDVHGDQGGYVHLKWWASPKDAVAEGMHISEYTVWRAIDIYSASALLASGAARVFDPAARLRDIPEKAAPDGESPPSRPRVLRADEGPGATIFWELVGTQPALAFDGYAQTVATLFDSTSVNDDYHYFQVLAHLDTVAWPYYVSALDSARSTDDLPPVAPLNLAGAQDAPSSLQLTWDANLETDLSGYGVYRGTDAGFIPSAGNLLGTTVTPEFVDEDWVWDGGYYYKVCAVDVHENESEYAVLAPSLVTGAGKEAPVYANSLGQNHPNPFNPATTIRYSLRSAGPVRLLVYDSAGRRVRTLVDAPRAAGSHDERWNGRDDAGHAVASGVYYYRLEAGTFVKTRKMVLLK